MKHELLRLYARITIFALRRLKLYDDVDAWYGLLHMDGDPPPAKILLERDEWLAETVQIMFNTIFDAGLMPMTSTWQDSWDALRSVQEQPNGTGGTLGKKGI